MQAGQKLNLRRKSSHSFHDKTHSIKVFEYLIGCVFMMLKPVCQSLFGYSYFLILSLHQNALYMYNSSMKSTKQEIAVDDRALILFENQKAGHIGIALL